MPCRRYSLRMAPAAPAARMTLIVLAWMLAACIRDFPSFAGGGTDTETGSFTVTGRVLTAEGQPAGCATVVMLPMAFLQDPSEDTAGSPASRLASADANGRFTFDSVPAGEYRIEASCGNESVASQAVTVAKDGGRSLEVGSRRMQAPGGLSGTVRFSDGRRRPFLVQVYGTGKVVNGDSATGSFRLFPLAPDTYRIRISSPIDFQAPEERDVSIRSGETSDLGEILMTPRPKQAFELLAGGTHLAGVGPDNPILYDNDRFDNTLDDEYLWAKTSRGEADLRGLILPGHPSGHLDSFQTLHRLSLREVRLARLSGMRNIPDPVQGAWGRLLGRDTGNLDRIPAQVNPGSALIVAEARKASVEKPLLVFCGGPLLTVANAYLMDPAIAERMVIFGAYNSQRSRGSQEDSLAVFLVARKCRFVAWAEEDFGWSGSSAVLPPSAPVVPGMLGLHLASRHAGAKSTTALFGDLSAAAWLFDPRLYRMARGLDAQAPPLSAASPAHPLRPDFLDIPAGATDYPGLVENSYAALASPEAYHPWQVPGLIEAEGFQSAAGATLAASDNLEEGAMGSLDPGDWMEYRLDPGVAGEYTVTIRGHCEGQGRLEIIPAGGGPISTADLPGPAWTLVSAKIFLPGEPAPVRLRVTAGACTLDWLRFSR